MRVLRSLTGSGDGLNAGAMVSFLDFEKPIAALQARVTELRETADEGALDIDAEIQRLQARSDKMLADTYAKLTPWQKTQVRSEEHTSELQSLMRISYAVFCLQKKQKLNQT